MGPCTSEEAEFLGILKSLATHTRVGSLQSDPPDLGFLNLRLQPAKLLLLKALGT